CVAPLGACPCCVLEHVRNLVARVDMQKRERHMAEKSLSRQPQQYGRIFPHRPQHGQVVKMFIGFSKKVDTLVFQLTKMLHGLDPLLWSMSSAGDAYGHRLLS